jgi:hypothetical protein
MLPHTPVFKPCSKYSASTRICVKSNALVTRVRWKWAAAWRCALASMAHQRHSLFLAPHGLHLVRTRARKIYDATANIAHSVVVRACSFLRVQKRPSLVFTPPKRQAATNTASGRVFALKLTPLKACCTCKESATARPQSKNQSAHRIARVRGGQRRRARRGLLSSHCLRYRISQSAHSSRALAGGSATHETRRCRVLCRTSRSGCKSLSAASRGAVAASEQLAGGGSGDGARSRCPRCTGKSACRQLIRARTY